MRFDNIEGHPGLEESSSSSSSIDTSTLSDEDKNLCIQLERPLKEIRNSAKKGREDDCESCSLIHKECRYTFSDTYYKSPKTTTGEKTYFLVAHIRNMRAKLASFRLRLTTSPKTPRETVPGAAPGKSPAPRQCTWCDGFIKRLTDLSKSPLAVHIPKIVLPKGTE